VYDDHETVDGDTAADSPVKVRWVVLGVLAIALAWMGSVVFKSPEPTARFLAFEARNENLFSYQPPQIAGAKFTGRSVENGGARWGDEFIQTVWRPERLSFSYDLDHDTNAEAAIDFIVADLAGTGWQLVQQPPTETAPISYRASAIFDDRPDDERRAEADVLTVRLITSTRMEDDRRVRRIVVDLRPDSIVVSED
jgi:hypothetical protein